MTRNYEKNMFEPISDDSAVFTELDSNICAECFGQFVEETNWVEVRNIDNGNTGIVHYSCYLDNDDVLEVI